MASTSLGWVVRIGPTQVPLVRFLEAVQWGCSRVLAAVIVAASSHIRLWSGELSLDANRGPGDPSRQLATVCSPHVSSLLRAVLRTSLTLLRRVHENHSGCAPTQHVASERRRGSVRIPGFRIPPSRASRRRRREGSYSEPLFAMPIFYKLSTTSAQTIGRLLVVAAKTKAKVGPHLPRRSTVLSGVKVAATVAGKVGSSVPYMQGIVDAANEVVACAEAMKDNRKECKKIAALTEELVKGLLAETEAVDEDDLSERSRLNLAELEWKLETIGKAMQKMRKTTLFQRLLAKGEHATQLVDHRRALQDAISKFQLMQCVRVDVCLTRIEKKQDGGIVGSSVDRSESTGGEGIEWLSVAVTQGLRSKNFFF